MASPTPILVSPSTTIVQVNPLFIPYTPVILNSYSFTGQVVTIQDATSSVGVLYSSIVVSTAAATQFTDGSISTLINQPQGFLTVQAGSPNVWSVLNSFPFRNQYTSAGTQNLTVTNLYAQSLSTIQEITSTVTVQNLLVSGNLSLSSAIVLNQSVSSLGTVNFFSTLTTWGSTFLSSAFSTLGNVSLYSTLTVEGNFITPSSIQVRSSMFVSGSVLAVGLLSTSLVSLSDSLYTYRLLSQDSTITSVDVGGSLTVTGFLNALSSLYSGSNLTSFTTTASYVSTQSSMNLASGLDVQQHALLHSNVSTYGHLTILQNLSTGADTRLDGAFTVGSNLTVQQSTSLKGFLSTQELVATVAAVYGNLQVDATSSNRSHLESVIIDTSLGFGTLSATSTIIGGYLSTPTFAWISGDMYGQSTFLSKETIRVFSSFSTLADLYVYGKLSSLSNVFVSGGVTVTGNFDSLTSFWNQSNVSSSVIRGNLSIRSSLTVTETIILSSIVLPSSVLANSFEVSSLAAGYKGNANSLFLSSLTTSSLGTGGILFPQVSMDMSNDLQTYVLSSFLLSSLEFQAQPGGNIFVPSTFFQANSSFGVGIIASTNTFDVNTIAYTLCNTFISKNISSLSVVGETMTGILKGDGRLLSNVSYPSRLSTSFIRASSLVVQYAETSSLFTSTLMTDLFGARSTLTVGQFAIYGNAWNQPRLSTNFIAAPTSVSNLLYLNNIAIYGDTAGIVTKQAIINSSFLTLANNTYTLAVGRSLRVDSIESPIFALPLNTFFGDTLVTRAFSSQNLYVSSGAIGISSGSLFIPETYVIQTRSTNTIQPNQSTLSFNSTLFIVRNLNRVGVNTFPFYTLDVATTAYVPQSVIALQSTIISDQIRLRHTIQNTPSFVIGTSTLQTASPCNYYTQLHFYNNPTALFISTNATPFISYGPSSLQLNKALFIDANQNIGGGVSNITGYTNTFYQGGSANITGVVSTNRVSYAQGYYLKVQSV